ncbi:MAG TPA: DUF2231 domain-containing protein [Micromonosporaceae bacterium]
MFTEVNGLPMHPLVVHAAVVLVPLLVLTGVLYALAPALRARLGWVAVALALLAPSAALLAVRSGQRLEDVLIAKGYGPAILRQVAAHREYGELAFWFTLVLGVATGLLVFLTSARRARRWPAVLRFGAGALVLVFGVLAAVYVFLAGESGARAVWTGVL